MFQSRLTVAGEMSRAAAVSSTVRPPKKRVATGKPIERLIQ